MTLGDWLIHGRTLTPPAIWGKLPAHGDFVRHRVRRGEGSAWQAWLDAEGALGAAPNPRAAQVPIAFVMPPGTLPFARRTFVVGAMLASHDRVGRASPLLLYQLAHPRWMRAYLLELVRVERGSIQDWLFYLTRLLAWHASGAEPSQLAELASALDAAWRRRAPGVPAALDRSNLHDHAARLAQPLLDFGPQEPGLDARWDPAAGLQGAHFLPWADWPQRQLGASGPSAFWQQDARGGFINAAERLQAIWNAQPCDLQNLTAAPTHEQQEVGPREEVMGIPGFTIASMMPPAAWLDEIGVESSGASPSPALQALQARAPTENAPFAELPQASATPEDEVLRALNREFESAVRSPSELQARGDWVSGPSPGSPADVAPTLEQLVAAADSTHLVLDIFQTRASIDKAMNHVDTLGMSDAMPAIHDEEVLSLFAPELVDAGPRKMPELTRREHHALSPDSPMRLGHPESSTDPT